MRSILALWRQAHAETGESPEDERARDRFSNLMRRRGWYRYFGGFKAAYVKGNLVAKFAYSKGDDEHTSKEWKLWNRARPFKRRFLARCYAYEDGLLIQHRWPGECRAKDKCAIAKLWGSRFRICDWAFNHAHRPSGMPVFFDYDSHGTGWDWWKYRTLLSRRAA